MEDKRVQRKKYTVESITFLFEGNDDSKEQIEEDDYEKILWI